mmetsp:Transcript_65281/g.144343  ORF Transcript_65281/g.144343 Transcript_65281/m.144343 type:complete len:424 (+) Transcript_65281:204-1475(+)
MQQWRPFLGFFLVTTAAAVGARAQAAGSGDAALGEGLPASCPTSGTAAAGVCVSLMQGKSATSRMAVMLVEEKASPAAQLQKRAPVVPTAAPMGHDRDRIAASATHLASMLAQASVATSAAAASAVRGLREAVQRRLTTSSSFGAIFGGLLLFAFVVAFVVIAYPEVLHKAEAVWRSRSLSSQTNCWQARAARSVEEETPASLPSMRSRAPPAERSLSRSSPIPSERVLSRGSGTALKSSRGDGVAHGALHFCPDLVVPEDCECRLIVPIRSMSQGSFDVTDLNGNTVLRVMPYNQSRGPPRFALSTGQGDVMAQCCPARPSHLHADGVVEIHLLRAAGDYFAKLFHESTDRYVLEMHDGSRLWFCGESSRAIKVTNESGQLLATAEGSASHERNAENCCLSVAPLVDVGLILCGLICADYLR